MHNTQTYKVAWVIELEADSFEDAARKAREIQLDPDSIATVFIVNDDTVVDVQLDENNRYDH